MYRLEAGCVATVIRVFGAHERILATSCTGKSTSLASECVALCVNPRVGLGPTDVAPNEFKSCRLAGKKAKRTRPEVHAGVKS